MVYKMLIGLKSR